MEDVHGTLYAKKFDFSLLMDYGLYRGKKIWTYVV